MEAKDWITTVALIAGPIIAVYLSLARESFQKVSSKRTVVFDAYGP
jgi:hypothetical protein